MNYLKVVTIVKSKKSWVRRVKYRIIIANNPEDIKEVANIDRNIKYNDVFHLEYSKLMDIDIFRDIIDIE